jgi:hypothetical protein
MYFLKGKKRKENRASGGFWQSKVVDPVFFLLAQRHWVVLIRPDEPLSLS